MIGRETASYNPCPKREQGAMSKSEAIVPAESTSNKLRYEQPRLVVFGEIGSLTAGGSGQVNEAMKGGMFATAKPIA